MNDAPDSEAAGPESTAWPKPVRYTLLILLGAVVGVGLVLLLYTKGFLPVAGPFLALFVAPVFVWLGVLWRRSRITHRSRQLAAALERLQARVEGERSLIAADRSTGASDASVDQAADAVRIAGQRLAWGQELEATQLLDQVAERAGRDWSPDAALTRELRRVAEQARPLAKAARRERNS